MFLEIEREVVSSRKTAELLTVEVGGGEALFCTLRCVVLLAAPYRTFYFSTTSLDVISAG